MNEHKALSLNFTNIQIVYISIYNQNYDLSVSRAIMRIYILCI